MTAMPLRQIITFALVGGTAAGAYGLTLALLAGGLGLAPEVANLPGVLAAAAVSYAGHHSLTFRAGGNHRRYLPRFIAQLLACLLVTSGLTHLTAAHGGHYALGMVLVVLVIPVVNYAVLRLWVFTESPDTSASNRKPTA